MTITIGSRVRLTADARERQPEIGHAIGAVFDLAHVRPEGADLTHSHTVPIATIDWPLPEFPVVVRSYHKLTDLERMEDRNDGR